jgi:anaerobic selenocysteine-containing dehydrogenase
MRVTRRSFLKISGAVLAAGGIGISIKPVAAYAKPLKIKYAKKTTTICPYCSVGCSIIISTTNYGKVINTEGDPAIVRLMKATGKRYPGNGRWIKSPETSKQAGTKASG